MGIRGGRRTLVPVGAASFGGTRTHALTFALVLLALVLTGCRLPPPEVLDFENDPRILRGSWTGWVDTRGQPSQIAISANASTVAAAWRNTIEVSNLASGELLTVVQAAEGPDYWLPDLALDGDGTLLAGIVNKEVTVWATADGSLVSAFEPDTQFGACLGCGARHLGLNPAGDLLAVAGTAQRVLVLGTDRGNVLTTLDTSGSEVGYVAFAADGTRLAAGSQTHVVGGGTDYFLNVWSVPSFEPLLEIQGSFTPSDDVTFAFSADGTHVAASSTSKAYVHDLDGGVTAPIVHGPESARLLALSPDAQQGAFTVWREANEHRIVVVDLESGDTLATFGPVRVERVGWSDGGDLLYVGSEFYTAADFQLFTDLARGALHELELVTFAEYVNPQHYVVRGTLTVDAGVPLDVAGTVFGGGSQRYIAPQYALPGPALLEIVVEELQWRMRAYQVEGQDPEDPAYVPAWHGYVTHLDDNPYGLGYQMRLERTTNPDGRQHGSAASND